MTNNDMDNGAGLVELRALVEKRERQLRELSIALTSLTCGGSEFFTRDGEHYWADPKACVEYARERRTSMTRMMVDATLRAKEAEKKLSALAQASVRTRSTPSPTTSITRDE